MLAGTQIGVRRVSKACSTIAQDWCISRQRTWGVPIALFVHKQSGELHPNTPQLIEQVALRVEEHGIEAWFELEAAELIGEDIADYQKVTDTWMCGLTPVLPTNP